MRYRKNYLLSHNIDWFCILGKKWVHVSSQGGFLPDFVDDDNFLPQLQALTNIIPVYSRFEDIDINEQLIKQRFERHLSIIREMQPNFDSNLSDFIDPEWDYSTFRSRYIASFVEMAQRGFYSYVRVNIDEIDDNRMVLVAKPTEKGSLQLYEDMASIISPFITGSFLETSHYFLKYLHYISRPDGELEFDKDLNNQF